MLSDGRRRVGPPRAHLIETEVGDEVSVYDARREEVVVLNATASDVWRLADGEHTLDEIVTLLASAYQVEESQIRPDVEMTIRSFEEAELLEGGDGDEGRP